MLLLIYLSLFFFLLLNFFLNRIYINLFKILNIIIYFIILWLFIILNLINPIFFSKLIFINSINYSLIYLSLFIIIICNIINNINFIFIKEYYIIINCIFIILIFLLNTSNILIFFIFFEFLLLPFLFLLIIYGSKFLRFSAGYFFFFLTFLSGVLMLIAIFNIYLICGSLDFYFLLFIKIPTKYQYIFFFCFMLSFLNKLAIFPFHIWLPLAHSESPIVGTFLLAGIMLKIGGYAIYKFIIFHLDLIIFYYFPFLIILSIICFYSGVINTLIQIDLKKFIAYASISHMGFFYLSILTCSIYSFVGSFLLLISHAFTSIGLFYISYILYIRTHTRIINYYSLIMSISPLFCFFFTIFILSNVCFPLSFNFICEFYVILGISLESIIVLFSVIIGIWLTAFYSFKLYCSILYSLSPFSFIFRDITILEFIILLSLFFFIIFLGISPNTIIQFIINSIYVFF